MNRSATYAILLALVAQVSCSQQSGDRGDAPGAVTDSVFGALLVDHLRANFDDLHDVSMRFHHMDHTIGGMIVFEMSWENGVLSSVTVLSNETGNDAIPEALIEKFSAWSIDGLDGPYRTSLPINIRLVGSDDPSYPSTAVLTGTVAGADGQPLHGARLEFIAMSPGQAPVPRATTNREGVFVRTLIPPGEWRLECSLDGWAPQIVEGIVLTAGQHQRQSFVLRRSEPGEP